MASIVVAAPDLGGANVSISYACRMLVAGVPGFYALEEHFRPEKSYGWTHKVKNARDPRIGRGQFDVATNTYWQVHEWGNWSLQYIVKDKSLDLVWTINNTWNETLHPAINAFGIEEADHCCRFIVVNGKRKRTCGSENCLTGEVEPGSFWNFGDCAIGGRHLPAPNCHRSPL